MSLDRVENRRIKDVWSEAGAFAESGSIGSSPRPSIIKQAETAIESMRECIVIKCVIRLVTIA